MNIKVCSGYVLIRPVVAETKTTSGIFLPNKSKEVPQKAIVVSIYKGEKRDDREDLLDAISNTPVYKEGDLIIYKKWEGWDFKPDGSTGALYRFIKEEDVLGIIEDEKVKK